MQAGDGGPQAAAGQRVRVSAAAVQQGAREAADQTPARAREKGGRNERQDREIGATELQ